MAKRAGATPAAATRTTTLAATDAAIRPNTKAIVRL
jgi:hypothetical protein